MTLTPSRNLTGGSLALQILSSLNEAQTLKICELDQKIEKAERELQRLRQLEQDFEQVKNLYTQDPEVETALHNFLGTVWAKQAVHQDKSLKGLQTVMNQLKKRLELDNNPILNAAQDCCRQLEKNLEKNTNTLFKYVTKVKSAEIPLGVDRIAKQCMCIRKD